MPQNAATFHVSNFYSLRGGVGWGGGGRGGVRLNDPGATPLPFQMIGSASDISTH